ncbi:MAG: alpha/beta fold hydrolase [Rhodobacteraceae bacterium]|nr:alpha/beta fold hydrolase [Paracoccaceae bacterium]
MTEPLVLVPGMMCDARIFSHQINHISRERAVQIAPIMQGDRVEEIASGLLDQLPLRFALAGVSMGGIVAMEILRRAPDRVSRLCLMSTSPLAETPGEAAAREPQIARARAGQLAEVLKNTLRAEDFAPGPQRMELAQAVWQMGLELGEELFVRQSRALQRRRDQQGTLRKSHVPTLLLCGAHDGLTPVRRHEFMAELMPNARLQVLEQAGHLPVLDAPDATTRALRHWLSQPVGTA